VGTPLLDVYQPAAANCKGMGLDKAKSLLEVTGGLTFLDLFLASTDAAYEMTCESVCHSCGGQELS
jgi:hypothetical protein